MKTSEKWTVRLWTFQVTKEYKDGRWTGSIRSTNGKTRYWDGSFESFAEMISETTKRVAEIAHQKADTERLFFEQRRAEWETALKEYIERQTAETDTLKFGEEGWLK